MFVAESIGFVLVCVIVLTRGEEVTYPSDLTAAFPYSSVGSVSQLGLALFGAEDTTYWYSRVTFGHSIVNLGDINNDGLDDVLIHSLTYDTSRGRAVVIYGSDQGIPCQVIEPTIDAELGFAIEFPHSLTGDEFGKGASGGDYNGDGFRDILIVEPLYNNDQGLVVIIWGTNTATRDTVNALTMDNTTGIRIYGRDDSYPSKFGSGVGAVHLGDFNGDGIDDFLCQAPDYENSGKVGAVYVIFGHTGPWEDFVVSSEESLIIIGGSGNMYLSIGEVATADFNGDNHPDIAVSSTEGAGAGVVYVLYWTSELNTTGIYTLRDFVASPTTGFTIAGTSKTKKIGQSSIAFCDVNGDGLQDLLVANPELGYCCQYVDEGDVTVVLGSTESHSSFSLTRDTDLSDIGFRIHGALRDALVGKYLGCLGDIDGDGYEDFYTNTFYNELSDTQPIVIYGHQSPFTDSSIDTTELETNGYRYSQYSEVYTVVNVGSFLGADNVTLAFTNHNDGSSYDGAVYFYSGFPNADPFPTVAPTQSPTAPTTSPTPNPSTSPTVSPSDAPTTSPTAYPTSTPTTGSPSTSPSTYPTASPTLSPTTGSPSISPTESPSLSPSASPTLTPTVSPSESPSQSPSATPTASPSESPSQSPSATPTASPSESPSLSPTATPTASPSESPTITPSKSPTSAPSEMSSDTPHAVAGSGVANDDDGKSHGFLTISDDGLTAAAGLGGGALVAAIGMAVYFYFVMKRHASQNRRSNDY